MAAEFPKLVDAPPTLYLPGGKEHDGFLLYKLLDNPDISVSLEPRKIRLLLALSEALEADAALAPPARGWRRPEHLIGGKYRVEPQTMRSYSSLIRKAVRKAFRAIHKGLPIPILLEHRRGLGVRLATPLEIIDRTEDG